MPPLNQSCVKIGGGNGGYFRPFSDKQIDEIKKAFTLFIGNKDGTVFLAQVEGVFKALGIHANEAESRVNDLLLFCFKFKMLDDIETDDGSRR